MKWIQSKANEHGVKLRPHAKTHKCFEIAALQREHGAIGITVAKISEGIAKVNVTHKSHEIFRERDKRHYHRLSNRRSVQGIYVTHHYTNVKDGKTSCIDNLHGEG